MSIILVMCISYCIGAFPIAWLTGAGPHSSFTSTSPNQKITLAGIDMAKGAIATLIALLMFGWLAAGVAAIFVTIGSMYSVFLQFRGGGGVAEAAGAIFILSPMVVLIGVVVFGLSLLFTRHFYLSTFLATIIVMFVAIFFVSHVYAWVFMIFLGLIVLFRNQGGWKKWRGTLKFPVD